MGALQEWTGQLVRQAREERGYSQQYVADEIAIDVRTLKKIEEGKTDPDYRTIYKLIRLLYISPKIMFYAEQSSTGVAMDREYRRLIRFTPDQIAMITESALHARTWCFRRASLSENRRRCVSEAAEVIWRKQNRVKEWP